MSSTSRRRRRLLLLVAVGVAVLVATAADAKFYYHNFRDRRGLAFVGGAHRVELPALSHCVSPASATTSHAAAGAVWYERPKSLSGGFSTTFHFTQLLRRASKGFAFVVQGVGPNALGSGGSGLGYGGLRDAIAVEFDWEQDVAERDPDSHHVSIHSGIGAPISPYESDSEAVTHGTARGHTHSIQITYREGRVKFFLNDLVKPRLSVDVGELAGGAYWVGFTSGISANGSVPAICDWDFSELADEACDEGFVGTTCTADSRGLMRDCLRESSCNQCVESKRDCVWCVSKKRCVAGLGVSDFCPDGAGIVAVSECLHVQGSLLWVWTLFIVVLVGIVFVSLIAKTMLYGEAHFALDLVELLFSSAVGALFAIAISFAVNSILVEISLSPIFAVVFGLVFIFIGGLIFFQTVSHHFQSKWGEFQGNVSHFFVLCAFCGLICMSGVICFVLDDPKALTPGAKVPLYSTLGVALCFGIVFVSVDLMCRLVNMADEPPLVENTRRVRLMAATAFLSGLYFGFVFGLLDMEDVSRSHIELALQQENAYCYPLSCFLGGFTGFLSKFWAIGDEDEGEKKKRKKRRQEGRRKEDKVVVGEEEEEDVETKRLV